MTPHAARSLFAAIPRTQLGSLPTPLTEAAGLRDALGGPHRCPRIVLKRDDLTGLGLGGNKVRKLEFLIADARRRGATSVLTTGAVQSNHARLTAAAARAAGLGVTLVLTARDPAPALQGNYLLDRIFGATIHLIPAGPDPRLAVAPDEEDRVREVVDEARRRGDEPYVIPVGGSSGVGALGYASGTLELVEQLASAGLAPSHLYYASGSRGTQAGLELGARLFAPPYQLRGIAVSGGEADKRVRAARIAGEAAALLGVDVAIHPDELSTDQGHIGAGYGIATPGGREAIRLLAERDGVLLDPTYTAKAMAALITDIRTGAVAPDQTVVFLHTGGAPALFAHAALFDT
ncbi:MAG TPA: D-cysteine desulfhydrase family protein [Kofleriaceae bacterium]|nr:D-cysteine desulfhydrase family protein [Kofleriaceae bacterium]